MDSLIVFLPFALLLLACPLGMAAFGGIVWLVARARGQKKEFSMCGMGSSCNHEEHGAKPTERPGSPVDQAGLKEEVVRLQQEVQGLQAQLASPAVAADGHGDAAIKREITATPARPVLSEERG